MQISGLKRVSKQKIKESLPWLSYSAQNDVHMTCIIASCFMIQMENQNKSVYEWSVNIKRHCGMLVHLLKAYHI